MLDEKTFHMIQDYMLHLNDLYFELEQELGADKTDSLLAEIDNLQYKYLGIQDPEFTEVLQQEPKVLLKEYEGLPKYQKIHVIREQDNGMTLGVTTSKMIVFIPSVILGGVG